MNKCTTCVGVCLALVLMAETGHADEFHYENLRFGHRAMGMGGAVTAYPIEPEASFYNPAGLAFLDKTTFSGALTFFGGDVRKLVGSFQEESRDPVSGDVTEQLFVEDERSDSFLALPSSAVISKSFGSGKQHVLAYSTFLVSESEEVFGSSKFIALPMHEEMEELMLGTTFGSSLSRKDSILYTGGSYGWRFSPNLGFGLSVFYARRDQEFHIARSQVMRRPSEGSDSLAPLNTQFLIANGDSTISDGALLARLGVFARLSEDWSVGASCSSRSIRLHGSADIAYTLIASGTEGEEGDTKPTALFSANESDVRAETVYPWNCRFGGALTRPSWTLTADTSIYLPLTYNRISLPDNLFRSDEFKLRAIETQFGNVVERETVVNAAVGVELKASPKWPLRAGVFTNFSAAPDRQDTDQINPTHIDLYGATLSAGYRGEERSINMGIEYQQGSGHDTVIRGLQDLAIDPAMTREPTFVRVERNQYRVLFFLAGAFEFAGDLIDSEDAPQD